MNIAIFTDTYPPFINGVSTSCYNLVKTLREHGHYVLVVTPRTTSGKLEMKDDIIYMPGFVLKNLYNYRLTRVFDRKIIKILKEKKIELIHNQTDITVGIFARRAAKVLHIPIVYTYHTAYEDYTYYFTRGLMDRIAKTLMRNYTRNVAGGATEFITPSDKTKDYMRSRGNDIYVNVIPTGIDFSIFDESKIDYGKMAEFKKEHGIDNDTKTILLLGRVAKEKSMDISIEYYAKFVEKYPNIKTKMIVVGDGPYRGELEILTHQLHISHLVDFIGFVNASEVPFYYHLADIYNSASITETQGLTFMEAMVGKAIVLARFDDNLVNTIVDGKTGFFFTDEASFIEKLYKALTLSKEDKEIIINNALEAMDQYSMDKFYSSVIEVYKRAIRKYW